MNFKHPSEASRPAGLVVCLLGTEGTVRRCCMNCSQRKIHLFHSLIVINKLVDDADVEFSLSKNHID